MKFLLWKGDFKYEDPNKVLRMDFWSVLLKYRSDNR